MEYIKKGDLVKFAEILEKGDERALMIILEERGERVLVQHLNTGLPIPPQSVYRKTELKKYSEKK